MKKILGYILSLLGVAGLSLTIQKIREITKITFLENISNLQITIVSVVLILIGIFLVLKSRNTASSEKEVPIYHGEQVVGYRRH